MKIFQRYNPLQVAKYVKILFSWTVVHQGRWRI
ncbi:putative cytoplasmic protein [Klebsiella pneumoniae]|uniref:Putative cytoplasmic protein n=1 Tax=Klebsiella pneumoniae TaxID=573 RepID=A0A2X3FFM4_KLEPN|nr:putative cytoplasmic protein [Klebsiella pneumoniae]